MTDKTAEKLERSIERLRQRVERLTLFMAVVSTLLMGDGALRLFGI